MPARMSLLTWLLLAISQVQQSTATGSESTLINTLRGAASGAAQYTSNAACLPKYCMNPIVPGLMMMGKNVLEESKKQTWMCASISNTKSIYKLGGFCSRIIASYPFSMPRPPPGTQQQSEAAAIQEQTKKALETYVGHISGMGFDFWDYTDPWKHDDECIQSVWRMSCYTHFPRCNQLHPGQYLPPCRNSCEGYLKKCSVVCCDEGVQCVFKHARRIANGSTVYENGYPDHKGPSPLCTGGTARPFSSAAATVLLLLSFCGFRF